MALAPGERRVLALDGFEAAVVPLAGSCSVEVGGRTFDLEGRDDVFSKVSDFAYLPVGAEAVVTSAGGGTFAMPTAGAERAVGPADVPGGAGRGGGGGGGGGRRPGGKF